MIVDMIKELWEQSIPENRCPYVSFDGKRCRCSAVAESNSVIVCDTASLQLWCLDGPERNKKCIFHPEYVGCNSQN